ncbi:MAG: hypothetical protein IPG92_18460 [Flavobacteriales bacterium]|nr:hypothetical protein [Flavobacteriales bacterium]
MNINAGYWIFANTLNNTGIFNLPAGRTAYFTATTNLSAGTTLPGAGQIVLQSGA